MDLTILTIVFVTSNLWGMYRHVPFTNINPSRSFLERAISSFQLTGAVYTLQEIHPLVFPEIVQERHDAWLNEHPPLQSELNDIIQHVMEEYMASRNVTNLSPYRVATSTAGSDGEFDPHVIGMHLKCLHPRLNSHNSMVKAVWEGLALASLGFSLLFFIWKENSNTTVNHDPSDSLATIVQTLLQDRLSSLRSMSREELVSILGEFMPNVTDDIASLKMNMGEIADYLGNLGTAIQPGYDAIHEVIENVYNNLYDKLDELNASIANSKLSGDHNDRISTTHLHELVSSIDGLIDVQKDITNILAQQAEHEKYGTVAYQSGLKSVDEFSSQVSHLSHLQLPDHTELEHHSDELKTDFEELQIYLQPVSSSNTYFSQLLEDLAERVLSIQLATTLQPFDEEAIRVELGRFREKQEALEANINQLIISRSYRASEMEVELLNSNFQKMEERLTAIEQLIATKSALPAPEQEGIDSLISTIHDLEEANQHLTSRLVIAESNLQKVAQHDSEINRIIKRIVHEGKFFSYATDVKHISLEELAKTFKNHVERFKSETQWLAEQVSPVAEHAARLDRLERSNKGSHVHLLECMKKLGIPFRLEAGDDLEEMLASLGVKIPGSNTEGQREEAQEDTCIPAVSQEEESDEDGGKIESPVPQKNTGLASSRWATGGESTNSSPVPKKSPGLESSRWATPPTRVESAPATPVPKKSAGLESSRRASVPASPAPDSWVASIPVGAKIYKWGIVNYIPSA